MPEPVWFKLHSKRTQPYTLDDISVVIPSSAGRYEARWKWFWPQYVEKTHPTVVENTIIPCDPEETPFFTELGIGKKMLVTRPRWIVPKTIAALDRIHTRLTFRLANDIMIVRKGWEDVLLTQFNAQEKLQLISEVQHGISYETTWRALTNSWDFLRREYPSGPVSAAYPHGSRLFAQTAAWNAYYRPVLRITPHDHDDIVFGQLARADGINYVHFGGIRGYIAHCGITNQDFTEDYIKKIEADRGRYEAIKSIPGFRIIE